jgi:hypothetical protein
MCKKKNIIFFFIFLLLIITYIKNSQIQKFKNYQKFILWNENIPQQLYEKTKNLQVDKYIIYPSYIYLDQSIPSIILKSNKKKDYTKEIVYIQEFIKDNNIKNLSDKTYLKSEMNYYIFKNCKITNKGLIIKNNNYIYNSSCRLNLSKIVPIENNFSKKYDRIINISGKWGSEYWHFLSEYLGCLTFLKYENYKINVNSKRKYVIDFLKLLNINEDNIISDNIHCQTLIQPKPLNCGNPSNEIINKLSQKLKKKFKFKSQKYFILIKRNKTRQLKYYVDLENFCRNFCLKNNLKLHIHDDNNLPELKSQLNYFHQAKIVCGPHGAGLSNIILSSKNTLVIELLNPNWFNLCFYLLAVRLGLNYGGIIQHISKKIEITKLKKILNDFYNL